MLPFAGAESAHEESQSLRNKVRDILLTVMLDRYLTGDNRSSPDLLKNPTWLKNTLKQGLERDPAGEAIAVLEEAGIDVAALLQNAQRSDHETA